MTWNVRLVRRVLASVVVLALLASLGLVTGTASVSAKHKHTTHKTKHHKPSKVAQVQFVWHGLSVQPPNKKPEKGKKKMPLFNKYFLQTQKQQRASIRFKDGTILHMNQQTDAQLSSPHVTYVRSGQVDEILAPGTNHKVQTATAVAAAIGTNFVVQVVGKGTRFVVVHGALKVKNKKGTQYVKTNQASIVLPNQAPQPPQPYNAQAAVTWTKGMPAPNLGENVALDANGGSVVDYSSQYHVASQGYFWDAKYIIDGRLDWGWESDSGNVTNQWVKIAFANNTVKTISEVIIDPAATHGDPSTADLKDFQIRVSTAGTADTDFTTVFSGTCLQDSSLQHFPLTTPVPAKYIELYALDNYGSPDWISVAEFEAVSKSS